MGKPRSYLQSQTDGGCWPRKTSGKPSGTVHTGAVTSNLSPDRTFCILSNCVTASSTFQVDFQGQGYCQRTVYLGMPSWKAKACSRASLEVILGWKVLLPVSTTIKQLVYSKTKTGGLTLCSSLLQQRKSVGPTGMGLQHSARGRHTAYNCHTAWRGPKEEEPARHPRPVQKLCHRCGWFSEQWRMTLNCTFFFSVFHWTILYCDLIKVNNIESVPYSNNSRIMNFYVKKSQLCCYLAFPSDWGPSPLTLPWLLILPS